MARVSPSKARARTRAPKPGPEQFSGCARRQRTPITPVEQTTTCCIPQPIILQRPARWREKRHAARANRAICVPGIDDDCAHGVRRRPHVGAGKNHGRRLREILREHGRSRRGRIRNDQRDVERSGVSALLEAAEAAENRKPRGSAREDGRSLMRISQADSAFPAPFRMGSTSRSGHTTARWRQFAAMSLDSNTITSIFSGTICRGRA